MESDLPLARSVAAQSPTPRTIAASPSSAQTSPVAPAPETGLLKQVAGAADDSSPAEATESGRSSTALRNLSAASYETMKPSLSRMPSRKAPVRPDPEDESSQMKRFDVAEFRRLRHQKVTEGFKSQLCSTSSLPSPSTHAPPRGCSTPARPAPTRLCESSPPQLASESRSRRSAQSRARIAPVKGEGGAGGGKGGPGDGEPPLAEAVSDAAMGKGACALPSRVVLAGSRPIRAPESVETRLERLYGSKPGAESSACRKCATPSRAAPKPPERGLSSERAELLAKKRGEAAKRIEAIKAAKQAYEESALALSTPSKVDVTPQAQPQSADTPSESLPQPPTGRAPASGESANSDVGGKATAPKLSQGDSPERRAPRLVGGYVLPAKSDDTHAGEGRPRRRVPTQTRRPPTTSEGEAAGRSCTRPMSRTASTSALDRPHTTLDTQRPATSTIFQVALAAARPARSPPVLPVGAKQKASTTMQRSRSQAPTATHAPLAAASQRPPSVTAASAEQSCEDFTPSSALSSHPTSDRRASLGEGNVMFKARKSEGQKPHPESIAHKLSSGLEKAKAIALFGGSVAEAKAAGISAADARDAGFTMEQLGDDATHGGYSLDELLEADYPVAVLRAVGASATDLHNRHFTPQQLAEAGYTMAEMRDAGWSVSEAHQAGFTRAEVLAAASTEQLEKEGFDLVQLKLAGKSAGTLKELGHTCAELSDAGYSPAELLAAGFARAEVLLVTSRRST